MSPKSGFVVGHIGCACDVNQPADAKGGVHRHAHKIAARFANVSAQNVVAHAFHIAQIVEKIANGSADGARRYFAIAACHRREQILIGFVVEFKHGAIVALVGIGRAFCAAVETDGEQQASKPHFQAVIHSSIS